MTMYARDLSVARYRSFDSYRLALSDGVTVLAGPNAAGKTNLIEALQLLTSGASFRHPTAAELVHGGAGSCKVELRLEGDGRVLDMGLSVEDGKRSFSRNGKRCAASGVRGVLPSVLFCPDHLDMVKRGAIERRTALDDFGVQLSARYADLASAYGRCVSQRNALLKETWCCREVLGAWNESLARAGSALLVHRLALLDRLSGHVCDAYGRVASGEPAGVSYVSTLGDLPRIENRDELRGWAYEHMLSALDERADEEIRRGVTLVGPHRDEIEFSVAGRSARSFASQGQQRTLVLAWKVAEVAVARDILGTAPLLLLDDVMSELDAGRRGAFLQLIGDDIQTVITTTNLGYFTDDLLDRAKVVSMGETC
ncbi:DNA replication and repair protein RecF [Collinsella aerofaciens]|uniref:DNA replication and repair protein RecF n=1 Tax=Collinsella aerofaciens TaxID=74426 RepID=A0A6N3BQH2_9ACTN